MPSERSSRPANRQGVRRDKRCRRLVMMSWAQCTYAASCYVRWLGRAKGGLSVAVGHTGKADGATRRLASGREGRKVIQGRDDQRDDGLRMGASYHVRTQTAPRMVE